MYVNSETLELYATHSEIRAGLNISFPPIITEEQLAQVGVFPITVQMGNYDELRHTLTGEYSQPIFIDNAWKCNALFVSKSIADVLAGKITLVEQGYGEHMFTDVTAAFPVGEKVIQFRSQQDLSNLSNVSSAALSLIATGQSDETLPYRTADNETQNVTAAQMVNIAQGVFSEKQQLTNLRWKHKDALRAFTTIDDILNYQITWEVA